MQYLYKLSSPYTSALETFTRAHGWISLRTLRWDLFLRRSFTEWRLRGLFRTEWRVVSIHSCAMAISTLLPKVLSLLQEDVRDGAYAKGSGNTMMYPCRKAYPRTVQLYTESALKVSYSAAEQSLIESLNVVEK